MSFVKTETSVLLPQTVEELETFIAKLTKDHGLPDDDETAYSISNMIMHLPATQAYAEPQYFADGVLRGMAQKAAYRKTEETRKRLLERDAEERKAQEDQNKLTLVENEADAGEQKPLQNA